MVDNAIIDLISFKYIALNNDHIRVVNGIIINNIITKLYLSINNIINSLNIIPITIPATTIVELCNRAEIGVGADIAFNNQELNGN